MANQNLNNSQQKNDQLIKEATVDYYDDDEYEQAILESVNDGISCPFEAQVLGLKFG